MFVQILVYAGILLVLAFFLSPFFLFSRWAFNKSLNRPASDYWNMINTSGFTKEDFILGNYDIGAISKGLVFRDYNGIHLGAASEVPIRKLEAHLGDTPLKFIEGDSVQKYKVTFPSESPDVDTPVCDYLGIRALGNLFGKNSFLSQQIFILPSGETLQIEFGFSPGLKKEFPIFRKGVEIGKLVRTKQISANAWILLLPSFYPISFRVAILSLQLIHA